jgi:hypothetical protein
MSLGAVARVTGNLSVPHRYRQRGRVFHERRDSALCSEEAGGLMWFGGILSGVTMARCNSFDEIKKSFKKATAISRFYLLPSNKSRQKWHSKRVFSMTILKY